MFEELVAATVRTSDAGAVAAWARVESAAAARRLYAMADMLESRRSADGSVNREQWYLDNWGAVAAEIGAAQNVTAGAAGAQLLIAHTLRERLPHVAAVFADGIVTVAAVTTTVWRTALITDPDALRTVDRELADGLRSWAPMSKDKLIVAIDAIIDEHDPYAVRRATDAAASRYLDVEFGDSGTAFLVGTLFGTDGKAFDARLDAIARTVCHADPRTIDQRRADAAGAMGAGSDRLTCLCERDDCDAEPCAGGSAVVYVVVNDDTLDADGAAAREQDAALHGEVPSTRIDLGRPRGSQPYESPWGPPTPNPAFEQLTLADLAQDVGSAEPPATRPGVLIGGRLLPGPISRRVALDATIRRIVHPGDSPPEPRYTPSSKLADFVRCRDLTCRFPGCDEPATRCDLDHTIPYPVGATQASNLKALCRRHHLLKTFWGGAGGWRDRQLPDGTVIWTGSDGTEYTTTPGSLRLFPALCVPTGPVGCTGAAAPVGTSSTCAMPVRARTRAQDRADRVDRERTRNAPDAERRILARIPPS